jgi:hypothetical protein
MKQQQEAERLAREAKKKAEEEAAKREKQKKLELEKQKREQERLRKEEEKRHREEERLKKEEEKKRRAKEEKERAAERERKRKEKEEQERLAKEKAQKAKAEKERLEQKAKEEKQRLEQKTREEKERLEKAKEEKNRIEREKVKAEKEKAAAKAKPTSPVTPNKPAEPTIVKTPSPPPGINTPANDSNGNRQQVLIEALVGSSTAAPISRPSFIDQTTAPIRPPPHLHPSGPFMPSHLDILQGNSPAVLSNPSPLNNHSPPSLSDNSPSMMGLFHNRVTSPLEPSTSSRRSITPIAPIGQPLTGRRQSTVPLGTSPVSSSTTDPIIMASQAVKRPSVASPFDSSTEPRSFFSSFLFGEPKPNNTVINNDYDMRTQASSLPPQFTDRRFSSDIVPPSQPQNSWTNGWAANSVLSDHVHGKLFGDVLVKYKTRYEKNCLLILKKPDRTTMTLERAKVAYQKLNEITQTNIFRGSQQQYHTLVQLHCMMNDLYCDFQVNNIRELYEVLVSSPLSGFQCVNHAQHGMVVLYEPMMGLRTSPPPPMFNNTPPPPPPNATTSTSPSIPPSHPLQQGNSLFGGMS